MLSILVSGRPQIFVINSSDDFFFFLSDLHITAKSDLSLINPAAERPFLMWTWCNDFKTARTTGNSKNIEQKTDLTPTYSSPDSSCQKKPSVGRLSMPPKFTKPFIFRKSYRAFFFSTFLWLVTRLLFEWWLNSSSSWGIWFWLFSSVWKPMMTHWPGPTTGHESLMNHLVWILPIGVSMDPAIREHWIYGSSTWRGPLNSSSYTWIRPSWPICAICSDVKWE